MDCMTLHLLDLGSETDASSITRESWGFQPENGARLGAGLCTCCILGQKKISKAFLETEIKTCCYVLFMVQLQGSEICCSPDWTFMLQNSAYGCVCFYPYTDCVTHSHLTVTIAQDPGLTIFVLLLQ